MILDWCERLLVKVHREDGWRSGHCGAGRAGIRVAEDGAELYAESEAREEDGVAVCHWA